MKKMAPAIANIVLSGDQKLLLYIVCIWYYTSDDMVENNHLMKCGILKLILMGRQD